MAAKVMSIENEELFRHSHCSKRLVQTALQINYRYNFEFYFLFIFCQELEQVAQGNGGRAISAGI